jgi:hypothetical protein
MELCFACASTDVASPCVGLKDTLFQSKEQLTAINYIRNLIYSLFG